jgi:hypothetical protein
MGETMNAEELLQVANEASTAFRSTMSKAERASIATDRADRPATIVHSTANCEDALLEFAAEGLGELVAEMRTIIDQRMEKVYRQALEVYYAAEELARDPAHTDLIPHVEAMRRGHERDCGVPIPPREGCRRGSRPPPSVHA